MFNHIDDEGKIYRKIDYRFKDKTLLLQALTRQSALNEGKQSGSLKNFQQLEFIGDKVLGLVMADILLENNPNANEGVLTIETAKYVNNKGPLAVVAKRLKLNKFIIVGRGEEIHNNVRNNNKVLSDAMEALLGALWLDSQRDYALLKKFISTQWGRAGLFAESSQLVDLQLIAINFHTSLSERIQMLKTRFEKPISQETINAFLAETAVNSEEEILTLTLSQNPSQKALNNALINAILMGYETGIDILLKHGADANTVYPPKNYKEWKYSGIEAYDQYSGRIISALHIAVTSSTLEIVKLLLNFGADANWNQGISTKRKHSFQETTNSSDIVLPEFSKPNSQTLTLFRRYAQTSSRKNFEKFSNYFTALHEIVNCRYCLADVKEIIILLIETHHVDPNAKDYQGDTPLHMVALDDTHDIYDLLIELGANPDIENSNGKTSCQLKQKQEYDSSDNEVFFGFFNS